MKKSLLFVNGHLQVGGVEKALVDLLSSIDRSRYDVDLLLLEGSGEYRNQVPENVRILSYDTRQLEGPFVRNIISNLFHAKFRNVLYRTILASSKFMGKRILYLLKYLLPIKSHYDVAIAFRPGHSAELVAYSVSSDKKLIWWHQGAVPDERWKIEELQRVLSEFDKVVTVSEGCREMLESTFHIPSDRMAVIPNIVNTEKIQYFSERENPYAASDKFKIVTLSRFAPEKHLEDAIEAAKLLKGKVDFVWYLIGDGSEFGSIESKVKESGFENIIVLTGRIANPYPYLRYADLMVHPSHVESLCIAVLETMALKVPCVVVRSIGPESFIKDGENGFLVDPGAESIMNGIERTLQMTNEELNSLKTSALRTVKQLFSPERVSEQFDRMIINE